MGEKFRQSYFNKALINNNTSILDNHKKTKVEFMNEDWKREKYLTFRNYNKK